MFTEVSRRACDAAGFRPVRGDDLFTPTDIPADMWHRRELWAHVSSDEPQLVIPVPRSGTQNPETGDREGAGLHRVLPYQAASE